MPFNHFSPSTFSVTQSNVSRGTIHNRVNTPNSAFRRFQHPISRFSRRPFGEPPAGLSRFPCFHKRRSGRFSSSSTEGSLTRCILSGKESCGPPVQKRWFPSLRPAGRKYFSRSNWVFFPCFSRLKRLFRPRLLSRPRGTERNSLDIVATNLLKSMTSGVKDQRGGARLAAPPAGCDRPSHGGS